MNENTGVSLNFQSPNISTVVYAVQNDKLSRHVVAQLRDGSAPWTPPAGALAAIRYLKPDGTGGFYDVDENNDPAISVSGSVATLTLAEQCTTVPGDVYMQLNFYGTDGSKLTTFAWILRVQKSVLADATIVSSDYYNVLTEAVAQVAADRAAVEAIAEQFTFPLGIPYGGTGANNVADARANLGLGAVAVENVLPIAKGGTGANNVADARANLGLGAVAVENVLPIAKGGTGANNVADARANLGAITVTEKSSSGNWHWAKYSDGTCDLLYGDTAATLDITTQKGGVYTTATYNTINLPFALIGQDGERAASVSYYQNSNAYINWAAQIIAYQTKVQFRIMSNASQSGATGILQIHIRGYWK